MTANMASSKHLLHEQIQCMFQDKKKQLRGWQNIYRYWKKLLFWFQIKIQNILHIVLTGKMDDELGCLELSVKSLCYLMNPENLHSQTKIPKNHIPYGYPVCFRRNTQKRLHILIVYELKLHKNYTNAKKKSSRDSPKLLIILKAEKRPPSEASCSSWIKLQD